MNFITINHQKHNLIGSLISFGLIGGNLKDKPDNPSMRVDEIIQFFKDASKDIFQHSNCFKSCCHLICGCLPFPICPFSQVGVQQKIEERFGSGATLKDFEMVDCIGGAVAKQYDPEVNTIIHK